MQPLPTDEYHAAAVGDIELVAVDEAAAPACRKYEEPHPVTDIYLEQQIVKLKDQGEVEI